MSTVDIACIICVFVVPIFLGFNFGAPVTIIYCLGMFVGVLFREQLS